MHLWAFAHQVGAWGVVFPKPIVLIQLLLAFGDPGKKRDILRLKANKFESRRENI
jgi:hypothetical protein